MNNRFPKRWMEIIQNTGAHSDDEFDPVKKKRYIKTLAYRSNNAGKFFRRLDSAMNAAALTSGLPKMGRFLPKHLVRLSLPRHPKALPSISTLLTGSKM